MNIDLGRTRVRRVLQISLAVALVGGVVATGGTSAVAAPEKVLQSVAISLGSDSTIRGVTSTTVRAGEGEELSSDSASLDPAAVSGELPVRVLTSYRLGDRTGTDLADIEGESGRVVVDVTVQNVTARPEQLGYDYNGTQLRQNALVATPLTVVASADLGEDALGTVVTADDLAPADVTNGVLGRSAGRSADVQWAALLAPPRLGSSATFRLVQDTDDFRVPTFDLSVQPGLVTDPSVQQLLEAAFSEDPSSTLRLETSTIELVSNVNATLTTASAVLAQIRRELGSTASTLGQKTIADLESSASLVSSSLSSLAGDIDSLSSQMSTEMERASTDTVAQFQETVGRMKKLLGDPAAFDELPEVEITACGDPVPQLKPKGSIAQQMMAISAQLRTIEGATDDCQRAITAGLNEAIGTIHDHAGSGTVIGSIRATQASLASEAALLTRNGEEIAGHIDAELLGYLSGSVGTLVGVVRSIQDIAEGIQQTGGGKLTAHLQRLRDALGSAQATLDGPDGTIAAVSQIATDAGAGQESNDRVAGRLGDVVEAVCDLQPADSADPDRQAYDDISVLLTGRDCAGRPHALPDGEVPIGQDVQATRTALQAISDGSAGAVGDLQDLSDELGGLRADVEALLEHDENRGDTLDDLITQIELLSDGERVDLDPHPQEWPDLSFFIDDSAEERPEGCDPVLAFELPAELPEAEQGRHYNYPDVLDRMRLFHKQMACNQFGIQGEIQRAFTAGAEILLGSSGELAQHVTDINESKDDANEQVGDLVDVLSQSLRDSDDALRRAGKQSVTRQREQLSAEQEKLSRGLDERIGDAVRRIEGTVSDSNRNLVAAERALKRDLDEVLLDLGTRDAEGTGLLGALVKGAADTGTATDSVLRANAATSEFAGVRSTALADVFLQQAQLSRSLELLEAYPAFGTELPAGSSHLTVFTFQIGGN